VSRPLPCGSGDTRRAALRPPVRPQCWFLLLAQICPTVMPEQSPHHDDAFGAACVVRIDAHGSKDRAKDASAERMRRSLVRASVHTLGRMRDVVPLLGVLRTSAVIGAPSVAGGYPLRRDGPTKALVPTTPREERRLPEDQDAFDRHDTRGSHRGGIAPSGPHAGSPAHAAHTFSRGKGAFDGHCKVTVRSPAGP
jgi:hypothetical protein